MSLYSHEEICEGCILSNWLLGGREWNKEAVFMKCDAGYEDRVDHVRGYCEAFERDEE